MAAAHIYSEICPHPNEVDRKRIEKMLAERERYKYVAPKVLPDVEGYLVRSPSVQECRPGRRRNRHCPH